MQICQHQSAFARLFPVPQRKTLRLFASTCAQYFACLTFAVRMPGSLPAEGVALVVIEKSNQSHFGLEDLTAIRN
jgi:hypothetical protein